VLTRRRARVVTGSRASCAAGWDLGGERRGVTVRMLGLVAGLREWRRVR